MQQKSERVEASERRAEVLGTVQYMDRDSLNGGLVSNNWPPLRNARRVGLVALIHVYEGANLGAEQDAHTHTRSCLIMSKEAAVPGQT